MELRNQGFAAVGTLQAVGELLATKLPLQQGSPAYSPLVRGIDPQRFVIQEVTTLLLQTGATQRQFRLFLDLHNQLTGLIADGTDIQGAIRIDIIRPAQMLQAFEQLIGGGERLLLRQPRQQDRQHVAGIAPLNGPVITLQKMADQGAALLQPFDRPLLPVVPHHGIQRIDFQQQDRADAVVGITHRRFQAIIKEDAIANAQLFIDEHVATDEGVEPAALLLGIGQLSLQEGERLTDADRPLVGHLVT